MVLRLVKQFELSGHDAVRIRALQKNNKRDFITEENYWKRFYNEFTSFLFKEKNCFDNYVGNVIKIIRAFFNYLHKQRHIYTGGSYKYFYVLKEQIPVLALLPGQVEYLINNKEFENSLSISLRRSKMLFAFGCMLALRFTELFKLRYSDIEEVSGKKYLNIRSSKNAAIIKVRLIGYTLHIVEQLHASACKRKFIFQKISKNQFNKNLKKIAEKAGWTNAVTKTRNKRGKQYIRNNNSGSAYRFCDLLSSHCMRRTAITMMLMNGIPEHIVRMVSGHTSNSKSFYRYISLVQSYLDNYIEKMHAQYFSNNNLQEQ